MLLNCQLFRSVNLERTKKMHEVTLTLSLILLAALILLFLTFIDHENLPAAAYTLSMFLFAARTTFLVWAVGNDSGLFARAENTGYADAISGNGGYLVCGTILAFGVIWR